MNELCTDIINEIMNYLNPKQIIILKQVSHRFNNENFLINRNNKDYPRIEGAHIHEVQRYDGKLSSFLITKEDILKILYDIYNKEQDIVRGDIFEFRMYGRTGNSRDFLNLVKEKDYYKSPIDWSHKTCGVAYFDGKTLIPYHDCMNSSYYHHFYKDAMIWFDEKQCLNNIMYGILCGSYTIYTKFIYKDNEYYIIYDCYDVEQFNVKKNADIIFGIMKHFCRKITSSNKKFYTKNKRYGIKENNIFFIK